MTIKEFIEKAIEGGWKYIQADWNISFSRANVDHELVFIHFFDNETMESDSIRWTIHEILLDPLAWQAVGKVEGWKEEGIKSLDRKVCAYDGYRDCGMGRACRFTGFPKIDKWHWHMHQMIDALAEGKSIEEFLETL